MSIKELEFSGRIDAEYYRPEMLAYESTVQQKLSVKMGAAADFLIGPFGSSFTVENYTDDRSYRYIRGKDVKPLTLMDNDNVYMPEADYTRLKRYALREDDILVSVVGTLGNSAIVTKESLPAIFSCKSTVVRPKSLNPKYLTVYLNCEYGSKLLARKERGVIQTGLNLDDLKDLPVFQPSIEFQSRIADAFEESLKQVDLGKAKQAEAETALLSALGLAGWTPPEPLSYTARAADALSAARLDAQFYAPRIRALLDVLGRDGRSLSDIAKPRRDRFSAKKCDTFHYIEIGDVEGGGGLGSTMLDATDAPSRATWHVRTGDVLTSTVRPIRRLSAIVAPDQDRYVASSGFAVLQPTGVTPEVLMTFLRLPAICELMDLYASASMYPAISEADILGLPIPAFSAELSAAVTESVQSAFAARARSRALLSSAKRAVEIAIEDGEAAALGFLSPG